MAARDILGPQWSHASNTVYKDDEVSTLEEWTHPDKNQVIQMSSWTPHSRFDPMTHATATSYTHNPDDHQAFEIDARHAHIRDPKRADAWARAAVARMNKTGSPNVLPNGRRLNTDTGKFWTTNYKEHHVDMSKGNPLLFFKD